MTIIHKGIRRLTTDVLADYGQAFYAQNWRYKRTGEIGRRPGLGKSNMAQMAGPVRAMICGNLFQPYLVQITGGDVSATLDPLARWTDPVMDIPDGQVAQPQAPVITSIVAAPASLAYPGGPMTATATISYDGLSGTLSYSWQAFPSNPGGFPALTGPGGQVFQDFSFDFACPVGQYGGDILLVTTQFNGFSTSGGLDVPFEIT